MSSIDQDPTIELIGTAQAGDLAALSRLLRDIEAPLLRLATRVLSNAEDAEDATQEILVKIARALARFEQRSRFSTWAFAIAHNHLRDIASQRSSNRALYVPLEKDAEADSNAAVEPADIANDPALLLEARQTMRSFAESMIACLDADHRRALVLVEIFDTDTDLGASVLSISSAAFRQRLSRARSRIGTYLHQHSKLPRMDSCCPYTRRLANNLAAAEHDAAQDMRAAPPKERIENACRELTRLRHLAALVQIRKRVAGSTGQKQQTNELREVLDLSPLLNTA